MNLYFIGAVFLCIGCSNIAESKTIMMQICVSGPGSKKEFLEFFDNFAKLNSLSIEDESARSELDRVRIREKFGSRTPNVEVINMSISSETGMQITAVNGTVDDEIIVGLTSTGNTKDKSTIDRFQNLVRQSWPMEIAPVGEGARGMSSCG